MNTKIYKLSSVLLLGIILILTACKDELYKIDHTFYDDKQIVLKNPLQKGPVFDTLRIEQSNTDMIMMEEPDDPNLVLLPEAFIYKVQYDSIVTVGKDGMLTPVSRGTTQLDITFRADEKHKTTIIVQVYKQYHAVEAIEAASLEGTVVEVNEPYDLSKAIIVLPVNADNKKLHFSIAEESKDYATITDEGVITGIKATGRNKAIVQVMSDEDNSITTTFGVQVVNEILITAVNILPALDGLEIGLGETIDLNLCTSVSPATVNIKNQKLTFELLEGTDVFSLDADGMIKAIGIGTAKLRATSKNGKFKEFTIYVKTGLTDLTRLLWTAESSVDYGYVPDGTTGMVKDMFDNNATTYFAVVKSGKTYNDNHTPASHIPYFIVDMKTAQKFNYVRWNHRSSNSSNYLRVWGIDIAGSNDGETFTDIQTEIAIPIESNTTTYHLPIPTSEYRYVKVSLTKWSDNSGGATDGSTMQVAEFGLGLEQ
ncbi:MAG: discoidin domain-containing protein [Paludibacteraceae bacterium]